MTLRKVCVISCGLLVIGFISPSDAKEISLREQATNELRVANESRSHGVLPTPATVRSAIEPVREPVVRIPFEAGLSIQAYRPSGLVRPTGMDPYQLEQLTPGPFFGVDLRWLPFKFGSTSVFWAGPNAGIAYGLFPVSLRTPAGESIEKTQLSLIKSQLGGTLAFQPQAVSRWGGRFEMGLGQMTEVLSSSSSFVNRSTSIAYLSTGIYGELRFFESYGVFLGYDYRQPIRGEPEEINLQRSNILAGLSGGFK